MKVPVKDLTPGTVLRNGHTVRRIRKSGDAIAVDTYDLNGVEHETFEAPDTKYEVEAVDITPTWSALLPIFVGVLQNPDAPAKAHNEAMANLSGMAALADKYVQAVKNGSGDTTGLTPMLTDPDAPEGATH